MADEAKTERRIAIQKIYVKDCSFESPRGPEVFASEEWSPKTNLNLRSSHAAAPGDMHEVVLTITVEAKHDDKTLFLIELHQAGLFQIQGYNQEEFEAVVGSFCPGTLFPYARETISSLVTKGGFPEFVLQPINFAMLYAESRKQAAARQAGGEAGSQLGGEPGSGSVN